MTRRPNLIAVPLAALVVLITASYGWAEEARAAVGRPDADADHNSFLGALSFSSSREPISVTADILTFDYRTRVIKYRGGVVVTQGDMKLESTTLTVALDEQSQNRVKEVVAEGQVKVSKGTRWATGGRAVFDQQQGTVVLSQNAVLHDGPNEVSGDHVVVYLDQQRSVVEGGNGRVKALLYPPKGETATPSSDEKR